MKLRYSVGFLGYDYLEIDNCIYCQSIQLSSGVIQRIICNNKESWMKVLVRENSQPDEKQIDIRELKLGVVIDLNENGTRWEGGSLHGNPFGFGCIYNEENQLIYKGFMYKGKKVCYGVDFYGDLSIIEYDGGYYDNMRFGKGKIYNKKNELVYEGEWLNDHPLVLSNLKIENKVNKQDIHFGIEELEIANNDNSIQFIRFIGFHHLKTISINNNCSNSLMQLEIENCNELTSVSIGKKSFNTSTCSTKTLLSIKNCLKLRDLTFAENACDNCSLFELRSWMYK